MGLHIKMALLDTASWGEEKQTSTKAIQVLFDVVLLTNKKKEKKKDKGTHSHPNHHGLLQNIKIDLWGKKN